MNNLDQAHRRLLDAVISLSGAELNGSELEVIAAKLELEIAMNESQELLYPQINETPHVGA